MVKEVQPLQTARYSVEQKIDASTRIVVKEEWYRIDASGEKLQNLVRHRSDGPALIERFAETGVVFSETWYQDGEIHREDGPAYIRRHSNTAVVIREQWRRN